MKRLIAISLTAFMLFSGCAKNDVTSSPAVSPAPVPEPSSQEEIKPEASSAPESFASSSPEKAAEELLDSISNLENLDNDKVNELVGQYFLTPSIPEEFYGIIKPLAKRVSYKIGNSKIEDDKATVDVSVTSVDAKKAINSVIPGAIAHLAAMQFTGKDISQPEKILAEYAANNIKWDELPTVKTDSTLYLVRRADGKWDVDATNPANMDFANAISGGAIEAAQTFKDFAERNK